jgi:TP901 family phage tail tape measure protein
LPTVLNLAAAGGIDLASASDMVTDAMSALGMGVDEADTMVDQMAKTASTTNTSVSQLGEGILTIGATAKSIKGGTAELNTALGILANNGIKGSEGGTHLRNVILSLQSPTDTAASCIEDLGLQIYDSEGNMRSLNDILGDLNSSMSDMSSEEKNNIISTIFNKTDFVICQCTSG